MLLAQIDNAPSYSPVQLAAWLGIAVFLMAAVVLARKVFGQNPPLHKEYVTKEQHAELKKEVDKLDTERRTSVAKIHDKIDAMGKLQSSQGAELESQTRQLHGLDRKMEDMPEKIIRLMEHRGKAT